MDVWSTLSSFLLYYSFSVVVSGFQLRKSNRLSLSFNGNVHTRRAMPATSTLSNDILDPSRISSVVADGDEMRRIDLAVSEVLSITRVQEVASTRLADLLTYHLGLDRQIPIYFVVGKGNNGANAIAAARHLVGRGRPHVKVILAFAPDAMSPMPQEQLKLFNHFGGDEALQWANLNDSSKQALATQLNKQRGIIVDGLLGTGITKPPRGIIKDVIDWVNGTSLPVLALDVPSGLNHVTGQVLNPCIRAKWTYNFHILKSGQVVKTAKPVIGELWTGDTDLTYTAWEDAGVTTESIQDLFSTGPIRRVF